jgi:regulator of protease activity HflC (stomatin/prohibitin superfamily)
MAAAEPKYNQLSDGPAAGKSARADGNHAKDPHVDLVNVGEAELPFVPAKIEPGKEYEELERIVNKGEGAQQRQAVDENGFFWWAVSALPLCVPVWCGANLVNNGELGLAIDNGAPHVLGPGWHFLLRPFCSFQSKATMTDPIINHGQVTIVRVLQGQLGLAFTDSTPRLLLPGLHVFNSPTFKMDRIVEMKTQEIRHGPVTIFTVASGTVRVCYDAGVVRIFEAGRYGINSPNFVLGTVIRTQQQNLPFDKHQVLLMGGINLLVQGLLTYQVIDVAKLITQLGEMDLQRAITDVTKAELARVFSGIHLEQISAQQTTAAEEKEASLLGEAQQGAVPAQHAGASNIRSWLCAQVVQDISPLTAGWGVKIINFQLESTRIADAKYAREYEEASLAMAKAKANRRAVSTQNDILIQQAEAAARAVQIEAEGRKIAAIKGAEARAESQLVEAKAGATARLVEADSRNQAALAMKNEFGKQLAMMDRNVGIATSLKANTLVVSADAGFAKAVTSALPDQVTSKR